MRPIELGIIYHNSESEIQQKFRKRLGSQPTLIDLWDNNDIPISHNPQDYIEAKIEHSKVIVILLSQNIVTEKHFENWLDLAIDNGVWLFSFVVQPCTIPSQLKDEECYPGKEKSLIDLEKRKEERYVHDFCVKVIKAVEELQAWENPVYRHLESNIPEINFYQQKKLLRSGNLPQPVSVILLEGTPLCGQDLLIDWLRKQRQTNERPIRIKASDFTGNEDWWHDFKLFYPNAPLNCTKEKLLHILYSRVKRQNEIIVVDHINHISPEMLFHKLRNFEQEFAEYYAEKEEMLPPQKQNQFSENENTGNKIELILINRGLPGQSFRHQKILENFQGFTPLPEIEKVRMDDLKTWWEQSQGDASPYLKRKFKPIFDLDDFNQPEGLFIKDAVTTICDTVGCPEYYSDPERFPF